MLAKLKKPTNQDLAEVDPRVELNYVFVDPRSVFSAESKVRDKFNFKAI